MKTIALITYGRSLMALTMAESVHSLVDRVVGVDTIKLTALSFSKYCDETRTVCEPSDEERYARDLAEICRDFPEDTVLVLPGFEDMEPLARHRDLLPANAKLAAPEQSSIEQVTPKHHFADLVEEHGINAPQTKVFMDEEQARDGLSMEFPVLMKPSRGAGGRGISKVEDETAYDRYLKDHAEQYPLLAQSLANGEDYCVSALAHDGDVLVMSAYTNLENQPREAGAGVVRKTVSTAPFEDDIRKIAKATNWTGVFETDFMWNGEEGDAPAVIEVNARFWAGLRHSTLSGVDYARLLAELTLYGELKTTPGEPEIGYCSQVPLAWIPSAVDGAFSESDYAQQLSESWERLKQSKGFSLKSFGRLLASLSDAKAAKEALEDVTHRVMDRSTLDVDLLAKDDPAAALGALFIVSHLVKYGELPPEVSFDSVGS
ncbi:ATP-grasp domain-containing protein [Oceanicaulis sp. MMSF_3324]|uniref:ATP-grasp domain-containing protein n=1 Tax=Oceanicaulis sp. MMSF_3324 TaxID=3046702 RepID=UPI00273DBAF6|nr:ATP-grasp domain-containing protein [Oceanicaulis sp. MMSF_3324]